MAKKKADGSVPEDAFLTGAPSRKARGKSPRKKGAELDPTAAASPEEAFLTGAADRGSAKRQRPRRRTGPSLPHPLEKAAKQWGCTKCGFSVQGDVILPLCPMCEGVQDFVERP